MAEILEPLRDIVKIVTSDLFKNLVTSMVTILIGFVIGKILGKLIEKILKEIGIDKSLRNVGVKFAFSELFGIIISYSTYIITVLVALNRLQLTEAVLGVIEFAFLIVLVVSILLGIKDFVPNIFAGFFIASRSIIKKGDHIKIKEGEGKVITRGLVETLIEDKHGEILYIPNSLLIKQEIVKIKRSDD